MARIAYCTTIRDELLNIDVLPDFECEVAVSVERDGYITIDAVYRDGKSLADGTEFTKSVSHDIANHAEIDLNTPGNFYREQALAKEAA